MKDKIKIWLLYVAAVAGICCVPFVIGGIQLQWMKIFGTEIESARTDIYRENKSYVEGTIRDFREMQVEYLKAEPQHRDALKSLILHRANELDWSRLPADVRGFLESLR